MTDTVRIMPRQPYLAKRAWFYGEAVWEFTNPDGDLTTRFAYDDMVEVSDPIVWDDTHEALKTIADVLPERYDCYHDYGFGRAVIVAFDDPEKYTISEIPYLNRIQIVGDSFVILPPEVES